MRDETHIDYDYAADEAEAPTHFGWTSVAGAVVSLAVLAAVVTWSYRLGVRDAHEVPVIRAMVQEMRVAPADPGGTRFDHQDRRVYDVMNPSAPPAPAAVVLAPPPEALAREDRAAAALAPAAVSAPLPPAVTEERTVDDLVAAALAEPSAGEGVARSPLPPMRPGRTASAAQPSTDRGTAFQPGTPAIQLGAYLTEEVARTMWRTLAARNGDLLAGRAPVVDVIVGTSRTLYGLRAAPFATTAEAQGLCAALRARNEDCLVTELR